jgi:hypothetical protein
MYCSFYIISRLVLRNPPCARSLPVSSVFRSPLYYYWNQIPNVVFFTCLSSVLLIRTHNTHTPAAWSYELPYSDRPPRALYVTHRSRQKVERKNGI